MNKVVLSAAIFLLATSRVQAQTYWTDFASALYKSDIEKMEKSIGIVPDPAGSVGDRFTTIKDYAISKLNYAPPRAETVPVEMMSLEEKILGKYTPPDEAQIKAALAATQQTQSQQQKSKSHKLRLPKIQWARSLPQYGNSYGAFPGYGPGGYAGPAAYGLPAPMPGTGTIWGTPQPFISQPVFVNGQSAGLLNTLPGGGYSYFGH